MPKHAGPPPAVAVTEGLLDSCAGHFLTEGQGLARRTACRTAACSFSRHLSSLPRMGFLSGSLAGGGDVAGPGAALGGFERRRRRSAEVVRELPERLLQGVLLE